MVLIKLAVEKGACIVQKDLWEMSRSPIWQGAKYEEEWTSPAWVEHKYHSS